MSQRPITNEAANALLVAPVFPDSEWLFFPHEVYPPSEQSVEKVRELFDKCRNRIGEGHMSFLFKGSYITKSVPAEYRNDADMVEGYKHIDSEDNFSFSVAIESYVEYLSKEDDYRAAVIRFPEVKHLNHQPPFPTHPLIEEVKINGLLITAETHQIAPAVLDAIINVAKGCLENCEHGGGCIPYTSDEEYEDNFYN